MKNPTKYAVFSLVALLTTSLVVCGTLSFPAMAENLVQNPGFETGKLRPWGKWNDMAVVDNDQRSGNYCLRAGDAPASSEQDVSGLTPSATYTLTGWAKLASGSSGMITIGVKDYGGSQIIETVSSTSYVQKSIDFTMGSSNSVATIFCYRSTGTGYAYCDDFYMDLSASSPTDTPESPTDTPVSPTDTPSGPTDTPVPPTDTPSGPTDTPGPSTSYYVDCSAATNGDGSQSSPWNNLDTVNNITFPAGSSILLKRGTTCAGTLWPKGSGSAGNANVIDAYGTGAQPHVQASCAPNGVYLYNQEYWEIRNLEISNDCGTVSNDRRGIYVLLEDYGTGTHYRILNNTIHDVAGDPNTDDPKHTGGIIFIVTGSTTQTKFSDVVVEGNTVYTADRSGFNMKSSWGCRPERGCTNPENYYPWDAFQVRNNTLYDIGGDGIVLQYGQGSTVEYNVVYEAQARSTRCNAGIWPWNVDNVTFQYNEAYNVRLTNTTCDGQGFDTDYGTNNIIHQYNYSHDNEGGFMLVCGPNAGGTVDAKIRYNISQNDKKHVFHVTGPAVTNAQIYNNTIYVPSGNNATIVEEGNWGGKVTSAYFWNNIFYILGGGGYSLKIGNIHFDYNIFYGNHPSSEPDDPHKITADPMLVNPGSGGTGIGSVDGYKIQAGSSAIQAGRIVADNGGQDYWGNPVPSDSAPDIGAHQYAGSGPTATPAPPTDTPVPTDTAIPPTDTPIPPTDTPCPPTDTPEPGPTDTSAPPTDTPVPPTDTPIPPTDTPAPPTDTPGPGGQIFFDGFEDGDMNGWTISSGADVQVRDVPPFYEGSYYAGAKRGGWFERTISTAGSTNVRVKYAGLTIGFDAGESLKVEWYDGSSWNLLDELVSGTWVYRDWDMPAGADDNAAFALRFTGNADKNTEWAHVDSIEVTAE